MKLIKVAARTKMYFNRGAHTLGLAVGLVSTCAIWYGLIPGVSEMFPNFVQFIMIFAPIYFVVLTIFGWWDYAYGMFRFDQQLTGTSSPITQDNMLCYKYIGEKFDIPELVEIADRWLVRFREDTHT